MPIYEYECRKCGVFDYEQSISAAPLARCPKCRSKVTKLISAPAFHLKGGGWYADGYEKKPASGSETSDAPAKASGEPAASSAADGTAAVAEKPKKKNAGKSPETSKKPSAA